MMRDNAKFMVKCSAGKGVLSATDCMACSLAAGHPPCGFDYGVLKAMYNEPERTGIHVTDLTGCLLASYNTKTEPIPVFVHSLLAMHLGTFYHSLAESTDEFAVSELPVAWDGLVGTVDRYYHDGRLVDYKTSKYLYLDKLPYGSHTSQVNIYAYILRKMGKEVNSASIQYICVGGPTKCRKHKNRKPIVEWIDGELKCPLCGFRPANAHQGAYMVDIPLFSDDEVEHYLMSRADTLRKALDEKVPPQADPGWLCAYCPFEQTCLEAWLDNGGE